LLQCIVIVVVVVVIIICCCYYCTESIWLHCALAGCGAVYYNTLRRSRNNKLVLSVTGGRTGIGVCYHDNSKLRASIFSKLGL